MIFVVIEICIYNRKSNYRLTCWARICINFLTAVVSLHQMSFFLQKCCYKIFKMLNAILFSKSVQVVALPFLLLLKVIMFFVVLKLSMQQRFFKLIGAIRFLFCSLLLEERNTNIFAAFAEFIFMREWKRWLWCLI